MRATEERIDAAARMVREVLDDMLDRHDLADEFTSTWQHDRAAERVAARERGEQPRYPG